ncbi:MAG TPA: hypothetical protein VFU80_02095 [Sphingomicrobium sp.]|nr:hypothetical protein [Sphingomicrobium sp.]
MIDELFDRTYQAGRTDLDAGLDRLFKRIGQATENAFRVLHRIEYGAPWLERTRKAGRA